MESCRTNGVTVLNAFLTYLEEHPATRVLADDFTDVLTHLGCLAAVPIQVDGAGPEPALSEATLSSATLSSAMA
jgi:hypothetical protein